MSTAAVAGTAALVTDEFDERARWCRAGIVNVHRYAQTTFDFQDGRVVLRGANGSGKTRAMDMLFPHLLSGDRRKMGSGTSAQVTVDTLMKKMIGSVTNRVGYVWAECRRVDGSYLTVGAFFKYNTSTNTSTIAYFVTPLQVGMELPLVDGINPLSRDKLTELVGAHRITDRGAEHRERVAKELYGVIDGRGMERFRAYLDLLYKLRAPDIGVRIEAGEFTRMLTESLPPLSDEVLAGAGEDMDGLADARVEQQRLEQQAQQVKGALALYADYAATILTTAARRIDEAAAAGEIARATEAEATEDARSTAAVHKDAQQKQSHAKTVAATLDSQIRAIERSSAYKGLEDLNEKAGTVAAKKETADATLSNWSTARAAVLDSATTAKAAAKDVERRAQQVQEAIERLRFVAALAQITADIPDVTSRSTTVGMPSRTVRVKSDDAELEETAPDLITVTVVPDPVDSVQTRISAVREAASAKRDTAAARRSAAQQLDDDEYTVRSFEQSASESQKRAAEAAKDEEDDAESARAARKELAGKWVAWAHEEKVLDMFRGFAWADSIINSLLMDENAELPDLGLLDRFAGTVALDARNRVAERFANLNVAATAIEEQRSAFVDERQSLKDGKTTLTPDAQPWATCQTGTQFWQAVDFRPDVPSHVRAAVETALNASGILGAVIRNAGAVLLNDELIVSAYGATARHGLSGILIPDKDTDQSVSAILDRIGFDDENHSVNINSDGSFRVGPTQGKPAVSQEARFIGQASQERARIMRIAELTVLIEEVGVKLGQLRIDREAAARVNESIDTLVDQSPSSRPALEADSAAAQSAKVSDARGTELKAADEKAVRARSEWDARMRTHRGVCEHAGLPWTVEALQASKDASASAEGGCDAAARPFDELTGATGRFAEAAQKRDESENEAVRIGALAVTTWIAWHSADAEMEQLRKSLGPEAETIMEDLGRLKAELVDQTAALSSLDAVLPVLQGKAIAAQIGHTAACEKTAIVEQMTREQQQRLRNLCSLPGVLAAGTRGHVGAVPETDLRDWLRSIIGRVPKVDVNQVLGIENQMPDVPRDYVIITRFDDEVLLIELSDADGTHSLAEAAVNLEERAITGRTALTREDHERFKKYILEGVAEDLRQSMLLAEDSIRETSKRVSQYRTSNNIGVKLRMNPNDTLGTELVRIRELVRIADPIRTEAETTELSLLLREVVEQQYAIDPSAGYEAALSKALDYRNWFAVDAIVLGPELGQERGIKGAGLSSGELRYVSYLTLICAADAHMLAMSPRVPRLILLDDAFAMVDSVGRQNLMKVIVERDIDFVMTGFDLWLAFPDVPGLDLYEIRTHGEDVPASAVHYHWDGRRRSLMAV